MNLATFVKTQPNNIAIDWNKAEDELGFILHKNIKDFYSRTFGKCIKGRVNFTADKFLKKTDNEKFDNWFTFNKCEGIVEVEFYPLERKNIIETLKSTFSYWTGGNDFGHRTLIGTFYMNIGQILILINNDTGKVEWIDCGYGYFDVYEQNPNGILADTITELLEKFSY